MIELTLSWPWKVVYKIVWHVNASQFQHHILQLQFSVAHLVLRFMISRLWRCNMSQHNCDYEKKIHDRGYFRLKLSLTSGHCPQWLMFFKNLFYQNNCKVTMNIGASKITGAFLNFFVVKKCPFFVSSGCCSQFLKLPLHELKLDAWFWNHDCIIKVQLFWTNLPMKLWCMNVVEDFKRNITVKLGSLKLVSTIF